MNVRVLDDVVCGFAGARQQGGADGRALFFGQLVVKPVIAVAIVLPKAPV